MQRGTDLYSRYQQVTSWPAVRKAGYRFCYMKLGEGTTTRSVAALHPAAAKQNEQILGGYWYAQPGNARAQANLLCDRAEALGLTGLAPALDIEAPFQPNKTAVNFAVAFCRQVKARGHRPALYANNTMMRTVRPAVKRAVPSTAVWVARYGASPTVTWDVWQWSDAGHPPGIRAGSVDLNKGVIPYNVTTVVEKRDDMNPKDLWSYRIRALGADGKPRDPKNRTWWAQTVLETLLQHSYSLHAKVDKLAGQTWSHRIPAVDWGGSPRDPKNHDWWASSVLSANLQNTYGVQAKLDALTELVQQQQQQINELTEAFGGRRR